MGCRTSSEEPWRGSRGRRVRADGGLGTRGVTWVVMRYAGLGSRAAEQQSSRAAGQLR